MKRHIFANERRVLFKGYWKPIAPIKNWCECRSRGTWIWSAFDTIDPNCPQCHGTGWWDGPAFKIVTDPKKYAKWLKAKQKSNKQKTCQHCHGSKCRQCGFRGFI